MASAALKIDGGTEIPGEEEGAASAAAETGARDYEAEALEHGWRPLSEFKGDPAHFIDAETFMKRADEMMPLLKAQRDRLKREVEQLKKDFKRANAHMEGIEKRAYEKALADLEEKHRNAVEAGDLKAATEAVKEIRELKPAATVEERNPAELKAQAEEALDAFREENPWYDKANLAGATETEQLGRIYWDRMVDRHIDLTKTMAPADFFAHITDLTKEKYPALFAKAPREKPGSAVEGVTRGKAGGASKTWDNLPPEAKRSFERMQGRGLLGIKPTGDKEKDMAASRAYYARTFDWEGFQA
jgi:hypothetical protein